MKIVYGIICHKNAKQVNQLILELDDNNVSFMIHVDKKSNIMDHIIKKENIHFIKDRVSIVWGDPSMNYATLSIYKNTISIIKEFDYLVILSGQDFLIKPKKEIYSFFQKNIGKEFMDVRDFNENFLSKYRYERYNIFTKNNRFNYLFRKAQELLHIKRLSYKKQPTFYMGSVWHAVTFEFVNFVLAYVNKNPSFLSFFNHVHCGDELFFQTIIMDSPFVDRIHNSFIWEIRWQKGMFNPDIYTIKDKEYLMDSQCLFARKFDIDVDQEIIEYIKESILWK